MSRKESESATAFSLFYGCQAESEPTSRWVKESVQMRSGVRGTASLEEEICDNEHQHTDHRHHVERYAVWSCHSANDASTIVQSSIRHTILHARSVVGKHCPPPYTSAGYESLQSSNLCICCSKFGRILGVVIVRDARDCRRHATNADLGRRRWRNDRWWSDWSEVFMSVV